MNAPMHPPNFQAGPQASNTVAMVSMISGIIATVMLFICCPVLSFLGLHFLPLGLAAILGIVSCVTGYLGLNAAKQNNGVGHGNAVAGLIMGVINVLAGIGFFILMLISGAAIMALIASGNM